MAHTRSVLGDQVRGTAVGSLFLWIPDAPGSLTPHAWVNVADAVDVKDALSLSIWLENDALSASPVTAYKVWVSRDNSSWTEYVTKTLGVPLAAGEKRLVGEFAGWKFPYVRVQAQCGGTATVSCFLTGSIFSAAQTLFVATEIDAFQKAFSRQVDWVAQSPNTTSWPPASNYGVDVSAVDYAWFYVEPTTPCDFILVGQLTTGEWIGIDGSYRSNVAIGTGNRMKTSGLKRIGVVVQSGTATTKIGVVQ